QHGVQGGAANRLPVPEGTMTIRRTSVCALAVALAATASACGQDPTITPLRNLERPADLDFVCMGLVAGPGAGTPVATGLPMSSCHDPNNGDEGDAAGGAVRATFGLLTNTARAEGGAISFVSDRLVDLDRRVPGYNMVPVGAQPEVLSVS